MRHVRSPYRWFFQWIMAVSFLLAAALLFAAGALGRGRAQAALCLVLAVSGALLLWAGALLALLLRAKALRRKGVEDRRKSPVSFLIALLNEERDLNDFRQELTEEILAAQAQMNSLQSQINPHFLYNTLESIRSKALLRDEDEIATMIETLARLFRYNISRSDTEASILDELENVKNYVRIQNYRFRDKFTLQLELDGLGDLLGSYMLPVLTLQPIVENAIHHGLEPKIGSGTILIRGFLTQSKLILQIRDDGVGMTAEKLDELQDRLFYDSEPPRSAQRQAGGVGRGAGIALKNVHQRLRLFFGPEYGLEIISALGGGTQIELCMPAPQGPGGGCHAKRAV